MKDIYEMLNYCDINLDDYNQTPLDDIYKERLKRKLHKSIKNTENKFNKILKFSTAALLILCFTSFISFKINPTFATEIPVVGNLIKNITGYGNTEFDKYTSVINKTVQKDGIKVTLNEVMLDDNQLRIATTFVSNEKMDSIPRPNVFINKKVLNPSGARGIGQHTDENTLVTVYTLDVSDVKLPSHMNIKISYKDIMFMNENSKDTIVKGPWEFDINVSKKAIQTKTRSYSINKTIKHKNIKMHIKDMTLTPLTTNIHFELYGDFPLGLIIKDNNGNELIQESSGWSSSDVFSEKLNLKNGNVSFSGIPYDAENITFIPYYKNNELKSSVSKNKTTPIKYDGNLPIVLKQNDENKITVYNIERKDGKIYVQYKTDGISCVLQKYRLHLYDSNKNSLDALYYEGNLNDVTNSNTLITKVFKDTSDGDIYIGTYTMDDIEIVKDQEFTIDLNRNK